MAELSELYQEAVKARHRLLTGASVVMVRDQSGDTIQYQQANISRLSAYINELERKLGINPCSRGPLNVYM